MAVAAAATLTDPPSPNMAVADIDSATGDVVTDLPRNDRTTGPQSDNDETTDTAPCLPFAPRSIAMGSAAIVSPEALRSLQVGVLLRA